MRKLYYYFYSDQNSHHFQKVPLIRKLDLYDYCEKTGYWNWLLYGQSGSRIQIAIDTMQAETKAVLLLHHGEDKSFEEIAALLCCHIATVRIIYSRGIDLLHSWFSYWHPV